jgi:hypothetical protein
MRIITPVIYAVLFATAVYAAIAQTGPLFVPGMSAGSASSSAEVSKLAYAGPSDHSGAKRATRVGKRESCRRKVAAKHLKPHAARDQLQLCVAQARVECLQQAIELNIRGAQRRLYVKSCVAA